MTAAVRPLTEDEIRGLTRNLMAGEVFNVLNAPYIALAVDHALRDPAFATYYGSFAVDQLHEACQ